jgi:hypothetical protein
LLGFAQQVASAPSRPVFHSRQASSRKLVRSPELTNEDLSAIDKIVEIVRPLLHHTPALGEVASAREDVGSRAARRADKLRARLGWEPGILNGNGSKPKWMRWRTFERLAVEHDAFVKRSMHAVALKFGLLGSDFRD